MGRTGNSQSIGRLIAREARSVPRRRMRCERCGRGVAATVSDGIPYPHKCPHGRTCQPTSEEIRWQTSAIKRCETCRSTVAAKTE
jgi:hypothetical protein